MNKLVFLCCLLLFVRTLIGQSPQQISYQGVARNASGTVLSNSTIAVKFDIHQGSITGAIVFTEQHQGAAALTTNSFGLFTTAIGSVSSLGVVNWANGPFFIEVSIDPVNGTSYNSVGTQQLMSVPFAFYAEKAGNTPPTPTLTINSPNTITSPSSGTYSINIAGSTTYSAGTGISISGGVISNTLAGSSPTITGSGAATVTSPSSNNYNIDVATQTLSIVGSTLSISSGNTLTLPENTMVPGNGNLIINKTGYDYTLTAVTPTLHVNGGTLTGTYPTQTLSISNASTSLVSGDNISLTQNANTYTLSAVTPTLNVSGGTLTGSYPTQTLTIPGSSTSLTQGANVTLNQSGSSYTVSAVTPTLNVSGGTLTGSYPTQTLAIPSSSTSLIQGSNITLNQSGTSYTVTAVTPTLNVSGGTLTGSYPTQTLTIPSSSTSLVQGSNVTLSQSGNTYTINAVTNTLTAGNTNLILNQSGNAYTLTPVTPTLNVSGGALTGSYPTQTLTIPSSSTTLVQGSNVTLSQSGSTYTVSSITPTLTAGTNVTITPTGSANAYTITAGTNSYTGTSGNIAITSNSINLVTTGVTAGTYGIAASNSVPVFTVDNFGRLTSASQYTPGILGDVTGNLNASVVARIRGVNVSATAPTAGQILQYSGSAWTPTTVATPWSLTGNAGTTTSNFIGTTDNLPLRIRTNNTVRTIFTESGQLIVGNNTGYGANSKVVIQDGHLESMQLTAPTIAGAGSLLGLLGSSASLAANSTDVKGIIAINLGLLGGAKGDYATITFNKAYANPPVIILTPKSEGAALLSAYVSGTSTTGFTLSFSTSTSGGFTVYEFNYMVIE